MKNHTLFVSALLTMLLSGCVVVTGNNLEGDSSGDWQKRQDNNKTYIGGLNMGQSLTQVRADLGAADFSEAFQRQDGDVVILRYRTQLNDSDGETTVDETTPLVFVNGALVGWGEKAASGY